MAVVPVDSNPFKWSEIHSLAKAKLNELDGIIRAEILACKEPIPANGGARHQFFLLLAERANDWASRGKDVYSRCLEAVGREQSQLINRSIWDNGLTFFIREKLREYMILACGIGNRELEWAEKGSPGVRDTPQVRAVIFTLRQINNVIQRTWENFRHLMNQSGDWSADWQKLIETAQTARPEDFKFVMGRAPATVVRDRGSEHSTLDVSAETDVASTHPGASKSADDTHWQQLATDFAKLAGEEKSANARPLRVTVISKSDHSSDVAHWKISDGYSENFNARFELLALQAGEALGPLPQGATPFYYWLHRLYQHLRENRSGFSRFFISSNQERPLIENACEASSTFCLRLQKCALEGEQKRALTACFENWIANNFVNVSIPPQVSERNRVSTIAESARTPIPIHFLSSRLQEINLPRGSTEFGSPRNCFDQIAETHGLIWAITRNGLWMAQQPPISGAYSDAYGKRYGETPAQENEPPAENAPATQAVSGAGLPNPDNSASRPTSSTTASDSAGDDSLRRANFLKRIKAATSGMTFRYQDAACACDVCEKTIRNWIDLGKLDKGTKRGTVTADSLKRNIAFD